MFGLDVGAAVLAGFIPSEEDHAAGFFGIALKHISVGDESMSFTPLLAMAGASPAWAGNYCQGPGKPGYRKGSRCNETARSGMVNPDSTAPSTLDDEWLRSPP